MARSKKTAPRKKARGRRWGAWVFAFLALVVCAAVLAMHISASVVHVQYAQVYLQDLPAAFEGTKLLFVSDIHLMGVNTPQRAKKLMESLAQLQPDLLLLGGDYTSQSLLEMHEEDARSAQASRRREFFEAIAAFPAPMGKYAVAGNHDVSIPGLREDLAAGNITLLQNEAIRVLSGNDALTIAGLDDFSLGERNVQGMGSMVASGDCVIVLSHSPDAFPAIIASEAADGGKWADLVLSGHTHGGQFRLLGWSPRIPSTYGEKYLSGWVEENGHSMLVSNGVGCSAVNLRWGALAQAHLITLYRAQDSAGGL